MALMDIGNQMVWQALKLYLPPGTVLSSVRRPPKNQLDVIIAEAKKNHFVFPRPPALSDPASWEPALEFLRKKGYQIAAPGKSVHERGLAYDLSGPDLGKIESAVRKAVADGRIRLLEGSRKPIRLEPINHCVHVEIDGALLDYEPFEFV